MTTSSKDHNPLCGYKFSINDFTDAQLVKLKLTGVSFGSGNEVLKEYLVKEILLQEKERRRFYWKVGDIKTKSAVALWSRNLFGKFNIPFPESFAAQIVPVKANTEKSLTSNYSKYWNPPETINVAVSKEFPSVNSLLCMPIGVEKLSSIEQIKQAYLPKFYVENYSTYECTHTYNLHYFTRVTLISSLLMGGLLGSQHGMRFTEDFDRSKAGKFFQSHYDIYFERYRTFLKGYLPGAYRWFWRCCFILGSTVLISQAMTIWRKKDSMLNYVAGAAVPGALYKWKRGPKGMMLSSAMFTFFFGMPIGFLCGPCGLNPRTNLYHFYYVPYISSPSHWLNWSDEKKEQNKVLMTAMLKELKTDKKTAETLSSQLYCDLLPHSWPKSKHV